MVTVVLFRDSKNHPINRLGFIFINYQITKQLMLCEWKDGMTEGDMVERIEMLVQEYYDWKLIVVDGVLAGESASDEIDTFAKDGLYKVIQTFCGKNRKIGGTFPCSVWYVRCCRRRPRLYQNASKFQFVDENRSMGTSFRMFWFEVDQNSERQQIYDWFRLNCAILILAINQIPNTLLECGYLYQLDIGIDRELFGQYVRGLESRLRSIRSMQENEWELFHYAYAMRDGYPNAELPQINLEEYRDELNVATEWEDITKDMLKSEILLDETLKNNRKRVFTRMYFPKGVLKGEASKIQEYVDRAKGTGHLLNDAGKDMVNREMKSVLEEMHQKAKKENIEGADVEKKLVKSENTIWEEYGRRQWLRAMPAICLFIIVIEYLLIIPFVKNLYDKNHALLENMQYVYVNLIIATVTGIILVMAIQIINYFLFKYRSIAYKKLLNLNIKNPQQNRIDYYENMLSLIERYQYCIRLKEDEKERQNSFEKRKKYLLHHEAMWKNGMSICRELQQLLREEERLEQPMGSLVINFDEEPKEIEYYRISQKENSHTIQINSSGYEIKTFFDFVKEFVIRKTLCECGKTDTIFRGNGEGI